MSAMGARSAGDKPGGRLIEQQYARTAGERQRQFKLPLHSVRERANPLVAVAGQPATGEQAVQLGRLFWRGLHCCLKERILSPGACREVRAGCSRPRSGR